MLRALTTAVAGACLAHASASPGAPAALPQAPCGAWTLAPATGEDVEQFGASAAFAVEGDTAVVGVMRDHQQANLSGALHVFTRQGAGWLRTAELTAPGSPQLFSLGTSVAIRGDTILAGSRANSDDGSVLVFERQGGAWNLVQEICPPSNGSAADARFGRFVHVAGDEAVILATGQERIYFFEDQGGSWVETGWIDHTILAPFGFDPVQNVFATGIAVDGERIAVENLQGPVYVIERDAGGVWSPVAELAVPGVDWFFHQAAIAGGTVAVGYAGGGASGIAYVFEEGPTGWALARTLVPSDASAGQAFGAHVSLFADRLLVGSNLDSARIEDGGSAYLFQNTGGTWEEVDKIEPQPPVFWGAFGDGVLLWGDQAFVGAPGRIGAATRGAVHVFDLAHEQGSAYCAANDNSTGAPAVLSASGSRRAVLNCLALDVQSLPAGQFGYFVMGAGQGFLPLIGGGDGDLCLALPFVRLAGHVQTSDPSGAVHFAPDLAALPGVTLAPGETWSFQYWTRDGASSNLSNGLSVTFATDAAPAVQFPAGSASRVEQTLAFEVELTLSEPTHAEVHVPFTTGGDATHDVDWRVEESNPLVIPPGATSIQLTLLVAGDVEQEGDETATISLGLPAGAVPGSMTTFTLTIVDDD